MNRCSRVSLIGLLLVVTNTTFAQSLLPRQFPAQALRGTLVVQQPPSITLDGAPARLSPGARIREANNMFVLSATLIDRGEMTVNYTLEANGLVHDVWILTEAEIRLKRPRASDLKN